MDFQVLSNDQAREAINSAQRFQALREAESQLLKVSGSMVWAKVKGTDYLIRAAKDASGHRRQKSLGPRSSATEAVKARFDQSRKDAQDRFEGLTDVMSRQAAINRVVGLGRVPMAGAKIIRALERHGLLGAGIKVVGTNAIYAFEAAAGVRVDPAVTTTEDIDLLLDSRQKLDVIVAADARTPERRSLLHILKRTDTSFERSVQTFRAVNRDGYFVDLIKPLRDPPWAKDIDRVGGDPDDLAAVEIANLAWLESAPVFEAVAIDERGGPLRIVTVDPRVWAAHKLWLSNRVDREPAKRRRDLAQACVVGRLVAEHLTHLPFEKDALRMMPEEVVAQAAALFKPSAIAL